MAKLTKPAVRKSTKAVKKSNKVAAKNGLKQAATRGEVGLPAPDWIAAAARNSGLSKGGIKRAIKSGAKSRYKKQVTPGK